MENTIADLNQQVTEANQRANEANQRANEASQLVEESCRQMAELNQRADRLERNMTFVCFLSSAVSVFLTFGTAGPESWQRSWSLWRRQVS